MSEAGENTDDGDDDVASNGRRSRICISCRTLFDKGEDCPGKNHRTTALRTTSGRNFLDDEVWGPDSRARALRQAARAGGGGAALGGVFEGCDAANGISSCDASIEGILGGLAALLVVAVVAIAAVVLWWLIKAIINAIRNAADRPKPHGALLEPPKPAKMAVAGRGVVRSGTPVRTPWKAGSAFAYAMELYEGKVYGGGAMLRDAATGGLEIALDDGRVLRIPEGRIRILGKRDKVDPEDDRVDDFVRAIDPERIEKERTVFPYDFARAVTIGPGDRVDVLGEVDVTADAGAAGYRANAGTVVPVGIPVLRVHRDAKVRVDVAPAPTADIDEAEAVQEEEEAARQQQQR